MSLRVLLPLQFPPKLIPITLPLPTVRITTASLIAPPTFCVIKTVIGLDPKDLAGPILKPPVIVKLEGILFKIE